MQRPASLLTSRVYRGIILLAIGSLVILNLLYRPQEDGNIIRPVVNTVANVTKKYSLPKLWPGSDIDDNQRIDVKDGLCHKFKFGGFTFNQKGRLREISQDMTSCLSHSFSPYVEREAAKRFIDPPHTNIFYANSPAIIWYHGELVLVTRIWLDREIYEPKDTWPENHFADNWLYTQKFDRTMKPISNGSIIGIPSPKQWWVGDGPIEPRLFKCKDRLFVTFNSAMAFKHKKYADITISWDLNENRAIIPRIKGGSPILNATKKDDMPRDKHWMALIQKDELYFVHNLDPLRIMKCDLDMNCEFIYADTNSAGFVFQHAVSHLRGGTPFELWQWPYYISIAHSTLYKETNNHRFYNAHMVVLCVEPYRVVYVSNDIQINPAIYQTIPLVRHMYIDDGFIFPVGLIIEDKDTISIGVHVSDHSSVIIRLKGMEALMSDIIKFDKRENVMHGPPVGYLQNHIHEVMENITHQKFVHPKEKINFRNIN